MMSSMTAMESWWLKKELSAISLGSVSRGPIQTGILVLRRGLVWVVMWGIDLETRREVGYSTA